MILASLALGLRQYPNGEIPNPKGLIVSAHRYIQWN